MRITAFISVLGLTALGAGLAWLSPRGPSEAEAPASDSGRPSVRASLVSLGPERPLGCPASTGADRVFHVSFETRYRFSMPDVGLERAPSAAPVAGSSRWTAQLHVRVEEGEAPQWVLALRDVRIRAGDPSRREVLAQLEDPVVVRFGPECRVQAWAFPEHVDPAVQNEWKLLLSLMEIVVPADASGRESWEVTQVDPTGEASVRYRWTQAPQGLERRKLNYRRLALQVPGVKHEARIRQAEATAHLGPDGGLDRIEGVEAIALSKVGETKPFAEVRTVFAFTRIEEAVADLRRPESTVSSAGQALAKPAGTEHFDPYPGPIPSDLAEATALYERELAERGLRAALGVLVPFLRAHPEASEALLSTLRAGSLSDDGQRLAFLALELAGTPEARAALATGLSDASLGTRDRIRAAAALPDSGEVGTVVDTLRRGATDSDQEVANAALLGLGRAAGRPELDPDERGRIQGELDQSLALASSPADRVVAMEAMANAGDPEAASAIEPYLESDHPLERAAAVESLNRLGASPSNDRSLTMLEQETDPQVQRALAEGLAASPASNDPQAVERVAYQLLSGEPLPASVARPLVAFLGARAAQDPRAREVLEAVLIAYRSREVRQMVGRYLEPTL